MKPRYPRRWAGVRGCRGCRPTAVEGKQPTGRPPYPPRPEAVSSSSGPGGSSSWLLADRVDSEVSFRVHGFIDEEGNLIPETCDHVAVTRRHDLPTCSGSCWDRSYPTEGTRPAAEVEQTERIDGIRWRIDARARHGGTCRTATGTAHRVRTRTGDGDATAPARILTASQRQADARGSDHLGRERRFHHYQGAPHAAGPGRRHERAAWRHQRGANE